VLREHVASLGGASVPPGGHARVFGHAERLVVGRAHQERGFDAAIVGEMSNRLDDLGSNRARPLGAALEPHAARRMAAREPHARDRVSVRRRVGEKRMRACVVHAPGHAGVPANGLGEPGIDGLRSRGSGQGGDQRGNRGQTARPARRQSATLTGRPTRTVAERRPNARGEV
jgi:hypothetical protein